ncbi:hypothetical protein P691DRAFT_788402 [Macrolepiota fuliginosa MF-IS2]|uniref:Ricin B lectin domain-containing protein n=1 Tax=Macrolepiota fuliginosa MF-IS2 TaxID=1400762 RepID=A0A9P5X4P4_9AGAR|nr:hypothetical protein P691DRAFT_788402 [Macrolepiota fuliginosa MF-IS2]
MLPRAFTLATVTTILSLTDFSVCQSQNTWLIRSATGDQPYVRSNGISEPLTLAVDLSGNTSWDVHGTGPQSVVIRSLSEGGYAASKGPGKSVVEGERTETITFWNLTSLGRQHFKISHHENQFVGYWTIREGSDEIFLSPEGEGSQEWILSQLD